MSIRSSPERKRSILSNTLLSYNSGAVSTKGSLPDVLASLGAREEIEFPGLRPHQAHPWHAFLVQLGALVVARSGDPRLDRPAEDWREALLALAGDSGEDAWRLVVDDRRRPAFLQVPVPEGRWSQYKPLAATPDDLDLLVTAKNHDVKQATMAAPRPEHWVYALVTLQTFQGYSGRGNFGVSRMNGGFGNRPCFTLAPGLGWAERFARDIAVWLEQRETLLDQGYEMADDGPALLWTIPWDGDQPALPWTACDPFFLEVCRRARLSDAEGRIAAWGAPSKSAFVDAKDRLGDVGDIWTPIQVGSDGDGKALTASPSTVGYRQLPNILFSGDWARRPALALRDEDRPEPLAIVQFSVRGQGKTEGYHERRIPIPGNRLDFFQSVTARERLAELAKARIDQVGDVQRKALKPALCALLQGGPDDLDFKDDRPSRWLRRLDREVDQIFFDELWAATTNGDDLEATGERASAQWEGRLYELAKEQLEAAEHEAAVPDAREYRARAKARSLFEGKARKLLKLRFPPDAAEHEEAIR